MAAPQHPDVLGGVQLDICSFWFLQSHDEPRFDSDDGDDNSEGVGLRRALDALVAARDGEMNGSGRSDWPPRSGWLMEV